MNDSNLRSDNNRDQCRTATADEPAGHPRPQLRRDGWTCLDGRWDFAQDPRAEWLQPTDVQWHSRITVPYSVETPDSGIGDTAFHLAVWYRRSVEVPPARPGERLFLYFGAVDHSCSVWVDGKLAGTHEGGYTPVRLDVTEALASPGPHELVVRAYDDPSDLAKPRGKQDWELHPHVIWYPRTTGIWQSVWLERAPQVRVENLQWIPELESLSVGMALRLTWAGRSGLRIRVRLRHAELELADDTIAVTGETVERVLRLTGHRVETMYGRLAWSPENPALIDALVELLDADGAVLDAVRSYTALRSVSIRGGRYLLNGRPYYLKLVLDQGYWPRSGYTPPSTDALRRDVELTKALGFNGVRKHQKVEDPRYLYFADALGLLVWAELPPAYRFDARAVRRAVSEWGEVIARDASHPCIVTWVTFNESAGLPDLPLRPDVRAFVRAVTHLTQALDPHVRPILANDGWENLGGDLLGVHDYEQDPALLASHFGRNEITETLVGFGVHGRVSALDDPGLEVQTPRAQGHRPVVLTEFGGIGYEVAGSAKGILYNDAVTAPDAMQHNSYMEAWGYSAVQTSEALLTRYAAQVRAVRAVPGLAGFCYTQLTDTYQEVNGLLTADRDPKTPLASLARATAGAGVAEALGAGAAAPA